MKPTASKRMIRIEKKKKKMAALLEISKLNEYDRIAKSLHTAENNSLTPSPEIEPNPKRLRTELNEASVLDIIIEQDNKQDKESIGIGLSGKPKVQGEEYTKLKKVLRERKLNMKAQPMLRLRELGEYAKLNADVDSRIPLFLTDIQHLLMYSQLGHHSPYSPARWCALDKFNKISSTVVLIIENMSLYYYWAHGELFPFMNSAFDYELEFLSPAAYKSDFIQDLAMVPITSSQMRKFINEYGTLETAVVKSNDLFDRIRNLFPVSDTETSEALIPGLPPGDKFPRTQLLLSGWQMVEENFPLPIKGLMDTKYYGYVLTKDEYKDVTPFSPLLAIDCEMCRTTTGDLEVTRVSIVNENMEVFYEQLVKPDNRIVDYLTQFSGITAKMMRNVTKRLQDVQEDLRRMLPADCILVGQSLANDMHALKMMHPYIIDTSVIFNITGERSRKTKLQTLSREFLSERIQEGRGGHCSVEDSMACMKLVKHRLSKSLYYGDAVMGGLKNDLRQYPNLGDANYATSMLKHVTKVDKTVRVVGLPDIAAKYIYYTFKELESKDPKKIKCVAENCRDRVVNQISEDTFSYSLNIAHIKITNTELEGDPERTIQNVDNWAKKVYNSTPHLGLCMVIFGGNNNENGCCFIKLKRQI